MSRSDTRLFTLTEDRRVVGLSVLATGLFGALVLRLFFLQIVQGPLMARLAERNRTQVIPLSAPRGLIYDRTGDILVDNAPRFSLFYGFSPQAASNPEALTTELTRYIPDVVKQLPKKVSEARRTGKMTRLSADLPRDAALALMERRMFLPGIHVVVEPQRRLRFGEMASHVLGYVDEVSPAELERFREKGFRPGEMLGKTGIEKFYDDYLRGSDGGLQFETDAAGRHVQIIQRLPSTPGKNIYLTLDRSLQSVAEEALARSLTGRGAAVVLDPRSGAVLALASRPGFDPGQGLGRYLGDPNLPLFNRALQGSYPPGSVFKIVTALAGLSETHWDTRKVIYCPGVFRLGTKEFGCWSIHKAQDFFGAVAFSCNVYFFNVGLGLGPDPLETLARSFGFGEKSGIDMPTESSGLVPGRVWKRKAARDGWYDGDTLNFCIGQGAMTSTPLQAAVFMAAVANRGTVWRPRLLDRAVDAQGKTVFRSVPQVRRRVELPAGVWDTLHRALIGVVTSGSGRGVNRPDLVIGAKTGTAQNPHGEDHSWFAAFAGRPGEPAALALAVFVENGGHGSAAAGPIARELINAYFPVAPRAG